MFNGDYLKQLRKSGSYTLARLSEETGYTASFLSQIERGLKEPSLTTLRKLSETLEVPIASFFSAEASDAAQPSRQTGGCSIVRKNARPEVVIPGLATKCEFVTEPSSGDAGHLLHGIIYTLFPGCDVSEGLVNHTYDECIYVLSGETTVLLTDQSIHLQEGDCIYINASTRHNFRNCGPTSSVLLSFSN